MKEVTQKIWSFFADGEVFLFLFLVVGQFKRAVPTVFGLDITLVTMIVATMCLLRRWFIKRERFIETSSIIHFGVFFIVIVFAGVSLIHTHSSYYGISKMIDLVFLCGWLVIVTAGLIRTKKSFDRMCIIWVAWATLLSLITITNYMIFRTGWAAVPLTTSYITASLYINSAYFICLLYYVKNPKKHVILILSSILLVSGFMLPSRSSFLLLVIVSIGIFVICLCHRSIQRKNKLAYIRLAACSLLIFITMFHVGTFNLLFARFNVVTPQGVNIVDAFEYIRETITGSAEQDYPSNEIPLVDHYYYDEAPIDNEALIMERATIYLNASPAIRARMNEMEAYYRRISNINRRDRGFIYNREQYNLTGAPLHFDHILLNNVAGVGRWEMLNISLRAIVARPFLGWGLGSFPVITLNRDIVLYPHNVILELWVEAGLLALIPFAIFLLYPLYIVMHFLVKKHPHMFQLTVLLVMIIFWMGYTMFADLTASIRPLYMFITMAVSSQLWIADEKRNPAQSVVDRFASRFWLFKNSEVESVKQ